MGYMQAYRVGGNSADSAIRKVSLLLTGEGIDCDELGEQRPDIGCVLIDFTAGEDLVRKTEQTVPQLPQIVVASSQILGNKQLAIADEFVSPDLPAPEIIRRVQCMAQYIIAVLPLAIRIAFLCYVHSSLYTPHLYRVAVLPVGLRCCAANPTYVSPSPFKGED